MVLPASAAWVAVAVYMSFQLAQTSNSELQPKRTEGTNRLDAAAAAAAAVMQFHSASTAAVAASAEANELPLLHPAPVANLCEEVLVVVASRWRPIAIGATIVLAVPRCVLVASE
jgi:hypothetical protein